MRPEYGLAIAAALLCCVLRCLSADAAHGDPFEFENDFISKIAEDGSSIGWKVARTCDECDRGVYATQPYAAGEVIGRILLKKCIDLGDPEQSQTALLFKVLYDADVNVTYGEYLKTLPPPNQTHCYLTMTEQQAEMLQAPPYQSLIQSYRTYADSVIKHLTDNADKYQLDFIPPLDLMLYYMALVTTRAFEFYSGHVGPGNEKHSYMCPLLDLLNNDVPGNVNRIQQSDGRIAVLAQQAVQEGDELTWSYHLGTLHRPDMQLLVYGFVEDKEDPALSGIDLPDFDDKNAFSPSPDSDSMDSYGHGQAVTELERVSEILDSLPTTEEQDMSILESGKYKGDYYSEQIVKWRVLRKRALKQRKEAVEKMLSEL